MSGKDRVNQTYRLYKRLGFDEDRIDIQHYLVMLQFVTFIMNGGRLEIKTTTADKVFYGEGAK